MDSATRFPTLLFLTNQFPSSPWVSSKDRGDIHSSRCTTGVVDTSRKKKKSAIRKVLIILFGHLCAVDLTCLYIFSFKFPSRCQQTNIVPRVNYNDTSATSGKICRPCRWYRWQICHQSSWTRRKICRRCRGAPWLANISVNFRKNLKWS